MAETRKCPQCGGTMVLKKYRNYEIYCCQNCSGTINCSTGKIIGRNGKLKFLEKIYVSCPNCSAPLFTKRNQGKVEMECPYCLHHWRFETGAPKVNENQWNTICPKCGEYVLINKNEGPRKIECPHCNQHWRFQSDTGEHLPDAEVREDCIIVTCPDCGTKNRVPRGKGNLLITCGICREEFYLMGDPKLAGGTQNTAPETEPEKVSYSAPQPEPMKSQPAPQSEPQENQPGFFEGISNFFKERKEAAEEEEYFIGESALTSYIGDALLGVMNELRSDLRGGSPKDYFVLRVYKSYCDLVFWKYNEAELKYEHSEMIVRIEYKTYQNIFQFKDGYTEIKSRKAKKWFRQVVFHEHMKNCGFLLMDDFDRICILHSQL